MHERFNGLLRGLLLGSRWSMAPLCLGLLVALAVVVVQFFRELAHALTSFVAMGDGDVMLEVLKLIDLVLIANLLVMIVGASAGMFMPQESAAADAAPDRSGVVDFGLLKLRMFGAISAIAAIYLLERFINIHPEDKADILWEILILLAFVVSGVLLALMDRLAGERH